MKVFLSKNHPVGAIAADRGNSGMHPKGTWYMAQKQVGASKEAPLYPLYSEPRAPARVYARVEIGVPCTYFVPKMYPRVPAEKILLIACF